MTMGAQDRDKIIRAAVITGGLLVVAVYGYLQLRTPDAPPPIVAPVVVTTSTVKTASGATGASLPTVTRTSEIVGQNSGATKVATTAAQYDPTLHMEAMLVSESLVYSGTGRNIFSANSAPVVANIPKPVAPVRTTGVVLPVYTAPSGPPPPPPIDLKFFGTAMKADGSRQAFLLHGEDVFLAATGSIVQRRYKIGTIGANSVEVEDLTNNNRQNLNLVKN